MPFHCRPFHPARSPRIVQPMRFLGLSLLLLSCAPDGPVPVEPGPAEAAPTANPLRFPAASRPVAGITSDRYSDEDSRDARGEAETVLRIAGIAPGMSVADIGAGAGYYTMRLAEAVGPTGMVIATDIIPDYLNRLRGRVKEQGFRNVAFLLGDADNPRLPPASTQVALLVHMYHEIAEPYAFLWHLHDGLKPRADGAAPLVAIIDSDRPTSQHGTPPALLRCELEATGYQQTGFQRLSSSTYIALFTPRPRPDPAAIKACPAPA